ncbi:MULTISPECIES: DUF421 domain-containing protein [Aneurinibacillus]|jgi:uncharacterized membrane protein YcaP (DUF421 family)|uniref:DUF421 domain-containing protein n=1 Tax=Aneurinibacillus danicus TaxID=267746 RepID=A0A511VAB6_9BACL|nr:MULTISPECIES: DUF421 domain-containing protein [Aneurinibacillus]GEN35867.1 hypothetical protein ADA01nite_33270 [Aneurinibacillus danicus]
MPEYLLILIRSLLSFVLLLLLARLMGKKQLSQLTFFDYVVGITIGSIAAALAIDQNIMIINGIIGLIIWGALPMLLSYTELKSNKLRHLMDGEPTVLIRDGKILEENMKKERMTVDELMLSLRAKNTFRLSDVEMAVMETNGEISVLKKSDAEPVTPKLLGMLTEQHKSPGTVIVDGNVIDATLSSLGYSREWLLGEIMKQGGTSFEQVFLAQIDSTGNVYIDFYYDKMTQPQAKQKPLLEASLKKVQADLELFALDTNDPAAKAMYQQQAKQLETVVNSLAPYLKE